MIGRGPFDADELFVDQFEPDGDGYLYRKSGRSAPIRVTAAERDTFIESYRRRSRILFWSFTISTFAWLFLLIGFAVARHADPPESWIYLGLSVLVLAFLLANRRIWNAPAVALKRRTPMGAARTRAEVRRKMLSRWSWIDIVVLFLVMLAIGLQYVPRAGRVMDTSDWLIFSTSGIATPLLIVVSIMKLRLRA